MNPTPFFRATIYALVILIVMLITIFRNVADAAEVVHAPVIERQGTDGVRKQIAWFTYAEKPGRVVLYCVPEGELGSTLSCVVFVVTDKGNAIILVDGIEATEIQS